MPTPSTPIPGARLSRRALLAGAAVLVGGTLTACTADRTSGDARRGRSSEPEVDPDVTLAAEALADVRTVATQLGETRDRHPGLAAVLAPAITAHEAHVALLAGAAPSPSSSPVPSPADSATSGRPDTPGSPVPRKPAAAVDEAARAELALAAAMKGHALRARSGSFARVLGSVAASAAQQAEALSTGGPDAGGGPR